VGNASRQRGKSLLILDKLTNRETGVLGEIPHHFIGDIDGTENHA